jgi:hypothetical protein
MKKLIWFGSALLIVVSMVLLTVAPAFACIPGLSPGYWKNHSEAWPAAYNPNISTGTTINAAFGFTGGTGDGYGTMTLMAALRTNGNSDGKAAFWRQAVATLLNNAGSSDEVAFLGRLVRTIYPNGGEFHDPMLLNGGASWWTLENWKGWFENLNRY